MCVNFTLDFSVFLMYHIIGKKGDVVMPIIYKIDVLNTLKEKGFNTTKLRRDKLLAESTIQQLRENKLVSWANIERLCSLLECQPGDLLEYVPEAE